MFPDDPFPPFTRLSVVIIVFAITLVFFHVILVYWLKLGKTAWKAVDYVWIGFAGLGLLGAAAQARQLVAQSRLALSESRVTVMYPPVRSLADMYSREGPVCRTFVRSPYSPSQADFENFQREYNAVCAWFKKVAAILPEKDDRHEITADVLPPEPRITGGDLKSILSEFRQQIGYYNKRAKQHADLLRAATRSETETTVTLISPLLLAVALALRITKVTGEIRLG